MPGPNPFSVNVFLVESDTILLPRAFLPMKEPLGTQESALPAVPPPAQSACVSGETRFAVSSPHVAMWETHDALGTP